MPPTFCLPQVGSVAPTAVRSKFPANISVLVKARGPLLHDGKKFGEVPAIQSYLSSRKNLPIPFGKRATEGVRHINFKSHSIVAAESGGK